MRLRFPKDSRKPRKGINMESTLPSILIRLVDDVPPLPKGFTYQMPELEAMAPVRRRKAEIVGSFRGVVADLVLTDDDELREMGL